MSGWRAVSSKVILSFDRAKIKPSRFSTVIPTTGRGSTTKKLTGVRRDDGQYRLRLGRWRFRYDITGQEVVLHYCGLRREDTYR